MGCGSSSMVDSATQARSNEIEAQLKRDQREARNEIKMLLLGAGESGKSTVLKQMKLIHHGSYKDTERGGYREIVFSNTIQSMRVLLEALQTMSIPVSQVNRGYQAAIMAAPSQIESDTMPAELAQAVQALWEDAGVRKGYERRNEMQLNDSAEYYFDNIKDISRPDYMPSDQDILRSRVKSTGITETTFKIKDHVYKIFDVGGQRSERKKWIHCFEDVTSVIFLVAISEYDQKLYEDETVNRMEEALILFDSICNSRWFIRSSIILFLNKTDIFREKLPVSPLEDHFPEYTGGNDYSAATTFIANEFISLNKTPTKSVYTQYTSAVDTNAMKFCMSAVSDHLIQKNLREAGYI